VTRHEIVVANFGDLEPLIAAVREQRLSVVPGRRSWLRQFHGASLAEL